MLYEIVDEDNAMIVGLVRDEERINSYIDSLLQEDKSYDKNKVKKFFINYYVKHEKDWYPINLITCNWVYQNNHYYDGEILPTGEIVE